MGELSERWKEAARTLFERRERRFAVLNTTEGYDREPLNIHAEADDEATLITSYIDGDMHAPVIDLDYEAILKPSSTEGHYHLFLEKEVMWDDYVELLLALAKCGLVEQGYADASIAKGYTAVRIRDKSEDPKFRKVDGKWAYVLPNGYSVPATAREKPLVTQRFRQEWDQITAAAIPADDFQVVLVDGAPVVVDGVDRWWDQ